MLCRRLGRLRKRQSCVQGVGASVGTADNHSECDSMIRPRPTDGMRTNSGSNAEAPTKMAEMAAIISLPTFRTIRIRDVRPGTLPDFRNARFCLIAVAAMWSAARMRALQQVVKEAQNASTVCAPQTSRAGIRSGYVPQFAALRLTTSTNSTKLRMQGNEDESDFV